MRGVMMKDRFGLSWRQELAPGIFDNLDKLDLVEVMTDDFFDAPGKRIRALKTLANHLPIVLHGVSLGLATTADVETSRLERTARLVDDLQPEFWSEHLAFVRAGGFEIGHLAAPPRNDATVEGAARNIRKARSIVGPRLLVENIATLIEPPASDCDELTWVSAVLDAADCDLLLDLHNIYANGLNFGYDPAEFIRRLRPERIAGIHIAGGRWTGPAKGRRMLDDHLHDVPDTVFLLMTVVGIHATRPLTVILERDGNFPSTDRLIGELDRARQALASGREQRQKEVACVASS